jgi:hypothetical protein
LNFLKVNTIKLDDHSINISKEFQNHELALSSFDKEENKKKKEIKPDGSHISFNFQHSKNSLVDQLKGNGHSQSSVILDEDYSGSHSSQKKKAETKKVNSPDPKF